MPAATLPSGEKFDGPAELRRCCWIKKDDFLRHLTGKLLGYALGRSLQDGDSCTVQQLADSLQKDDYRARTLIREIVLSVPFRNSQGGAGGDRSAAAASAQTHAADGGEMIAVPVESGGATDECQKRISRRTVLRGAGAALALPWLETMAPARAAGHARIRCPSRPCAWSSCTCRTAFVPDHWTPEGDGEDYEITPHLKPLEEPEERFHAAGESLEREDRRAQRPLAEGAGVAFRRLRGAHLGRRSGFRRHFGRSVGGAADRRPHHAAQLRTRPRSHPHRHRYRGRRLRPHVRLVHLLARSAYAGTQGDRAATGVRPPVPLEQSAGRSPA